MSYPPYRRGNNRGRGGLPTSPALSLPPDRDISEGLVDTPITTLTKPAETAGKDIDLKNFEYIGSYNWIDAKKPTIIVPGSPSEWRDRAFPYRVPRDSGIRFVDQNGYRMPSSTLYPLLRAVDIVAEENGNSTDWSNVDFVTDRNGLRKLLRWINDTDGSAKPFRIDTQLAGNHTILLNRWEKKTREGPDPDRWSFGYSFERESTIKVAGCEQSTGHHRIVKYDLDGLTLIVRFEVDACIAPARRTHPRASSTNVDNLSDLLSGLNVSVAATPAPATDATSSTTELDVIRAGSQVAQESIVEMTTRSKNYAHLYDWEDAYPQLFFSQTTHHFLAVHNRGEFQAITKRKLGDPEMKQIDRKAQGGIRRLRHALSTIQELVMDHGQRGRLSLVCQDGKLRVYERRSPESTLPEDLLRRFEA